MNRIIATLAGERDIVKVEQLAERIEKETDIDWAGLSVEMGYYDQAHLIRDFKAVLGKSPEEYARDL